MSAPEQLGSKYLLEQKIAVGGMAEIWLARQQGPAGFSKRLVIKRILPSLASDAKFVEMFLDEARLAAQLEHPNIVRISDLGELHGSYFIAMEFIDGPDLDYLTQRAAQLQTHIPPGIAARLMADALGGLDYAHNFADDAGGVLGLVHRDISPHNILISSTGVAKVCDFGVAKAATSRHKTQAGAVKGKFAYMSPEQIAAHNLDGRSDVFAMGIVLYEITTGQRPFGPENELIAVTAILTQEPSDPRAYVPNYPLELEQIIRRALQKRREDRYGSAREMQQALERFLQANNMIIGAQDVAAYIQDLFGPSPSCWAGPGPAPLPEPRFETAQLPWQTRAQAAVRGSGPTGSVPTGSLSGVPSGSLSGVPSGSLSGVPSGSLSGVPSGSLSGVPSGSLSGVPSGSLSGVPSGSLSGVPSLSGGQPWSGEVVLTEPKRHVTSAETLGETMESPKLSAELLAGRKAAQEAAQQPAPVPTLKEGPSAAERGPRAQTPAESPVVEPPRPEKHKTLSEGSAQPADARQRSAEAAPKAAPKVTPAEAAPKVAPPPAAEGGKSNAMLFLALGGVLLVLALAGGVGAILIFGGDDGDEPEVQDAGVAQKTPEEDAALEKPDAKPEVKADAGGEKPQPKDVGEPPKATTGKVVVFSTPEVDVYHEGKKLGRAPAPFNLPLGEQTLTLRDDASGIYKVVKVKVAAQGLPEEVSEVFEFGRLKLQLKDKAASITLDGRALAGDLSKPISLNEGPHTVTVQDGGKPVEKKFDIKADQETVLALP